MCGLLAYKKMWTPFSKVQQCKGNLSQIAKSFSLYTAENEGRLPYAYFRFSNQRHSTWDGLLEPYFPRNLPAAGSPPTLGVLRCPSDTLEVAGWAVGAKLYRRSYSMAEHDMQKANWPVGAKSATGVGLWWNLGAKGELRPDPVVYNYENTNKQAALKISEVPNPAGVLLLGEQVNANNIARLSSRSTIAATASHLDTKAMPLAAFQGGRFNYLMVDGSVQLLKPEKSVGPAGSAGKDPKTHQGIWTIKPED